MSEIIAFYYDESKNPRKAFIAGVPNRDLTFAEFEALSNKAQASIARVDFFIPAIQPEPLDPDLFESFDEEE